jgi:hypothetical protein
MTNQIMPLFVLDKPPSLQISHLMRGIGLLISSDDEKCGKRQILL